MSKGKVVVSIMDFPIPCSGAPVKFSFMLDSYLRNVVGKRDDIEITITYPAPSIGPLEFDKFVSKRRSETKGSEILKGQGVSKVDANKKKSYLRMEKHRSIY